jgi:phosphatidylserine/phosphatidylglycerophosphate/cardiolipin synthase-like enzyme
MHAKFVVSDRTGGYFGTANLTSFGLGEHLELGLRLAETQARTLVNLLDALDAAGFFSVVSPGS